MSWIEFMNVLFLTRRRALGC